VLAIDASKSVTQDGWTAQSGFAVSLIDGIMGNGNPNQHGVVPYWFNAEAVLIGENGVNKAGTYKFDASSLTSAISALSYPSIRAGSTDHPQVMLTAEEVFNKGRSNAEKVLVLITDGVTHKGLNCGKLAMSTAESKAGKCTGSHVCNFAYNGNPKCDSEKCMCGLYHSKIFSGKGYKLVIVGIPNQHHVGEAEAGMFKKLMDEMASPGGKAFVAFNFEDLPGLLPSVISYLK